MEPFSSAASDSPQRCKTREATLASVLPCFFTSPCICLNCHVSHLHPQALRFQPRFELRFLYHLPTEALSTSLTPTSIYSFFLLPYVLNFPFRFRTPLSSHNLNLGSATQLHLFPTPAAPAPLANRVLLSLPPDLGLNLGLSLLQQLGYHHSAMPTRTLAADGPFTQ